MRRIIPNLAHYSLLALLVSACSGPDLPTETSLGQVVTIQPEEVGVDVRQCDQVFGVDAAAWPQADAVYRVGARSDRLLLVRSGEPLCETSMLRFIHSGAGRGAPPVQPLLSPKMPSGEAPDVQSSGGTGTPGSRVADSNPLPAHGDSASGLGGDDVTDSNPLPAHGDSAIGVGDDVTDSNPLPAHGDSASGLGGDDVADSNPLPAHGDSAGGVGDDVADSNPLPAHGDSAGGSSEDPAGSPALPADQEWDDSALSALAQQAFSNDQ